MSLGRSLSLILSMVVLAAAGCDDLEDFASTPGESHYVGCVVGNEGTTFIRSSVFDAGAWMDLQFDPDRATQVSPRNVLTVHDPDAGDPPLFEGAELRPIVHLLHDALADYDFPGAGRIRNYLFFATPESGVLAGRDATVFVSLMESGTVEVRVIAGKLTPEGEEHFGFFRLERVAASVTPSCTPTP